MSSARRSGLRRASRAGSAAALALLLAGGFPGLAAAEDTVAFTIGNPQITESSGLTRDVGGGIYWTVNDSGDGGVVYGVKPTGALRGTLSYRAQPQDVEAVAMQGSRLYVADIGDNGASRDFVTVYYFNNPAANGQTVTYNSYDFRYPDGPHDAETLLVDGSGRLYLVTKGGQGGVYVAPQNPSRAEVNVLRRVGDAPALVTDGVFLPGGDQIALLTYSSVIVVDANSYERVSSAVIPAQRQAESIAVNLAGDALLIGSEGRNSPVYAVPVPLGSAPPSPTSPSPPNPSPTNPSPTNPSASGTPAPSTPAGSSDPGGSGEDEVVAEPAGASRSGTYLAVGLAALVAVVAGVVVATVRRPG